MNANKMVKFTIRLNESEKSLLDEKAARAKKSLNRFVVDTALGVETVDHAEAFLQAQRLVQIQRRIDDLEDNVKQCELRKECAEIWHGFEF